MAGFEQYRDQTTKIIEYCDETVKSAKSRKDILERVEDIVNSSELLQPFQRNAQIFNDSIHGSIEVNSLEKEIINSPEFFRLNNIKQLGGKFHVYCGATHTRFQHSIGVCYLAAELMDHLKKQENDRSISPLESPLEDPITISLQDEWCVRIAGLCHDLGHGPFSHLFESVMGDILSDAELKHEDLSKLIFKKILLDNPKVLAVFVVQCKMTEEHVKKIEEMIAPTEGHEQKPREMFLYEIVANKKSGMDVDKWDYFARDFLHLGVTNEFDWRRCMKMTSIVKVELETQPETKNDQPETRNDQPETKNKYEYHIGFRDKEITNIYGMFRTRSILYLKALRHTTVEAIEMMLKDILCLVKDVKMFDISGIDSPFGELISLKEVLESASQSPADLRGYMALTDSILHFIMYAPVKSSHEPGSKSSEESESESYEKSGLCQAQKLIRRLQERDLYKCVHERSIEFQVNEADETVIDAREKKAKKKVKDYERKDHWEMKLVCLKLTSEIKLNPVKEEMHFFPKPSKSSELKLIPLGSKEGQKKREPKSIRECEIIKSASPLCKPQQFFEYRIRMYRKNSTSLKSEFDECFDECFVAINHIFMGATRRKST